MNLEAVAPLSDTLGILGLGMLGLAMVFGIIQQHQGWIDCLSRPGEGTTFEVYLPRSTAPAAAISWTSDSSAPPTGCATRTSTPAPSSRSAKGWA